jgi:nucleotide-binding universal stress UspA family protein
MYSSIIVPLDGSVFGEYALPLALNIARRAEISLDVVHVNVTLAPLYAERRPNLEIPNEKVSRRHAQKYLDDVVTHVKSLVSVKAHGTMLEGGVTETLQSFTEDRPDSLVVMTTHGRGPVSRFWLGSVTDQFVRVTPAPLLLVHPGDGKPALGSAPTLPHILIPLDGSLLSEEVLEPAIALGKLMNADYTLLRVVEPLYFVGQGALGDAPIAIDPGWLKEEEEVAKSYLERVANRLRERRLRVVTRVRDAASVANAILDEAHAEGLSCLAVSTHGRRGLVRMALGSVADKLIRGGTLPTLLFRPHTS